MANNFRPKHLKFIAAALYVVSLAAMKIYSSDNSFSLSFASSDPILSCLEENRRKNWENSKDKEPTRPEDEYPVSPYTYSAVSADELPKICQDGDLGKFQAALEKQITRYRSMRPEAHAKKKFKFGCKVYTRQEYALDTNVKMLEIARKSGSFPAFISRASHEFDWYRSDGRLDDSENYPALKKGTMQFTAYYLPAPLEASRKPTELLRHPFYKVPPEVVHLENDEPGDCGKDPITGKAVRWCSKREGKYFPLPKRKDIDAGGALKDQGLEIGYVADPIDIAFLMVQGSGSLNITEEDGSKHVVRINYGGQNGGIRYMLSSILKCAGAGKDQYSSMNGIREYLRKKPRARARLLNYDETYIFFNEQDVGPFGVEDIPITDRSTIATDVKVIPTGAVTLFNLERPEGRVGECDHITSMAVAQDVGGAIKGAHVDWYQGEGDVAASRANKVNSAGVLYVAVPKGAGREIPGCNDLN